MCDSHSPPQHRTLWKSILTDTGLSGVNTDQHYWKQKEQVGPYPFCFTWVLLDGKGNLFELCFLEPGLSWMIILFDGSWSTLFALHWTHLRCRAASCGLALHLCWCLLKFLQMWKYIQMFKSDWRIKEKSKSQTLTGKTTHIVFFLMLCVRAACGVKSEQRNTTWQDGRSFILISMNF